MPALRTNSIDDDGQYQIDHNRRAQADCLKQSSYCLGSIALFILAGMIGNPEVAANIPGGAVTSALITIGIVIGVLILCRLQMK